MKTKTFALVLLLLITNLSHGQVKFRIKKLNADSLVALIPEKDDTELVEVLNLLSNVICLQNPDSSQNLANLAIQLSEELNYDQGLADGYFNLGNSYYFQDDFHPTVTSYLKALRIYEHLPVSMEYAMLCLQLYAMNIYTGRYENSLRYAHRALQLYDELDDTLGIINANFKLEVIYGMRNECDSSLAHLESALFYLERMPDQNILAALYNELGRAYRCMFDNTGDTLYFDKAISTLEKGLELKNPNIWRAELLFNYGEILLAYGVEKRHYEGISYLNKSLKQSQYRAKSKRFQPLIYRILGWERYLKGDADSALLLAHKAILSADDQLSNLSIADFDFPGMAYYSRNRLQYHKQIAHDELSIYYSHIGNYKEALNHYTLSKKVEEELYMAKNQDLLVLLELESEDEKSKNQIDMLAKDNELQAITIKQSRAYLFALLGFILILVLLTILFFRQRKTRVLIREQKLLHDLELKNMESEKLKDLDSMKSRFFANISHEFRTPLTLIKGPLEKVLSNPEDTNILKELGVAKKYTGKLQTLINNLLTISKLESGKMSLLASETDVVKLVGTYMQSFESLAKQKNIALIFKAEEENIKAYIDREKFEQVLNNLLSNAFKFTDEGGKVEVAVSSLQSAVSSPQSAVNSKQSAVRDLAKGEAGSSQTGDTEQSGDRRLETEDCRLKTGDLVNQWVSIKISDTGKGIPPNHLPHIFDRFYQAGHDDNSYYEGSGIGLALTKELVELHHGKIEVESQIGQGTLFTIILPLGSEYLKDDEIADQNEILNDDLPETRNQKPDTSNQKPDTSNQQPDTSNQKPETAPILLIVEDNADMRSYIRGYFEQEYNIIEAVDGLDGYEKSTEHIPDLIISDVMMPNMDGNEFCNKVKMDERTSHIPVILLTARASKESRMEGLETGADDFITKPFDGDELLMRVKNLIDQRKRLGAALESKIQKSGSASKLDLEGIDITSMDDKFLQKAKEVIENNRSNPEYTIEDFASAMALSRSQLHRKLKALINSSGTDFINTIRMNYALELLQKKAGTISEIAYDSGYNNPNYFSKIFRRKFGMSPSEYQDNPHK